MGDFAWELAGSVPSCRNASGGYLRRWPCRWQTGTRTVARYPERQKENENQLSLKILDESTLLVALRFERN
jgi:hypothetical protein